MCQCGCNGTCSTDPIQAAINKSINLLQKRMHMRARFDHIPWLYEDRDRAELRNDTLPVRGALVEYRGDLPERAQKAGQKTHAADFLCMKCTARAKTAHRHYDKCSVHSWPFELRTHEHIIDEMMSHLVFIHIATVMAKQQLLNSMHWLQAYPWGRTVFGTGGRPFRLKAGDRLIIGRSVVESPHEVDDLIPPFDLAFFRPRDKSGISGTSIMCDVGGLHNHYVDYFKLTMFVDCSLHTVDLGVSSRFVGNAIVAALRTNVFGLTDTSMGARMAKGILCIKQELKPYYRERDQLDRLGQNKSTRVKKLTLKRLGSLKKPCLKAKGAETKHIVPYCIQLLRKCGDGASDRVNLLLQAGLHLQRWYDICDANERRMSIETRVELFNAALGHVLLYKHARCRLVYKHHAFSIWHKVQRSLGIQIILRRIQMRIVMGVSLVSVRWCTRVLLQFLFLSGFVLQIVQSVADEKPK